LGIKTQPTARVKVEMNADISVYFDSTVTAQFYLGQVILHYKMDVNCHHLQSLINNARPVKSLLAKLH